MLTLPIYQVDAFTSQLFKGNPAAVCLLNEWLPDTTMQNIAAENNLAETAFVMQEEDHIQIRWFTPTVEVDLCGHATLAAAFVLFSELNYPSHTITFYSLRSGILKVLQSGDELYLDFPTDAIAEIDFRAEIAACCHILPQKVYKGKSDYMAIFSNEKQIQAMSPDLSKVANLAGRGLIVTAAGSEVDFVSRFFAPQSGINEDPVTGSAHTSLIPYWSQTLGKTKLTARQISVRGGDLTCQYEGNRCKIGGKAKLYLKGEIQID